MCGVPQKSVERTPTSGTGSMCCVTLWRHGVGTHDDLVPRGTSFGTVTVWDCRLVNVSRSQYLPNKRTLGAMRQKTIWCTGWRSSLSLTSHKVESGFAAGWRPPKSGVGKKTGDLATRRGRGDPARGSQERARTTLKKGLRPGAPQPGNANSHVCSRRGDSLVPASHWYENTGQTCGYLRSTRQRYSYLLRWWVCGASRTTHTRSDSPQLCKFQTMRHKLTTDG